MAVSHPLILSPWTQKAILQLRTVLTEVLFRLSLETHLSPYDFLNTFVGQIDPEGAGVLLMSQGMLTQ